MWFFFAPALVLLSGIVASHTCTEIWKVGKTESQKEFYNERRDLPDFPPPELLTYIRLLKCATQRWRAFYLRLVHKATKSSPKQGLVKAFLNRYHTTKLIKKYALPPVTFDIVVILEKLT